ncbi:MAG: Flp family type IVb pilin, partial [Actinomycetes bacterium]
DSFSGAPMNRTRHDDTGASAVEYGLIVFAIAGLIVLLVYAVGGYVKGNFKETCSKFAQSGTTFVDPGNGGTCQS